MEKRYIPVLPDETKEEITEKATGHKWNDGEVTTAPTKHLQA